MNTRTEDRTEGPIRGGIIYETRALYGRAAVLEEVKTLDARGARRASSRRTHATQ